jgi:hypothetical protein
MRARLSHHGTGRVLPSRLRISVSDCCWAFLSMSGSMGSGPQQTNFTGRSVSVRFQRATKANEES